MTAKTIGAATNYSLTASSATTNTTYFTGTSFPVTPSGSTFANGTDPHLGTGSPTINNPLITLYQYSAINNLVRVDQKGIAPTDSTQWRTRTFVYNSLSQLLTAANPESGTITYTYDNNGNPTTKTDARGITINYSPSANPIDALNRVKQKTYSNGDPSVSYSYDSGTNGIGRRTGMTDASGSSNWVYDALGRVSSQTQVISGITKTIGTTYNLDGSVNTVTYPTGSGSVLAYTYTSAGRLTTVQDTAHTITYMQSASYTAPGGLNFATFGAAKQTTIYNSRLQPCWMYVTTGTQLAGSTLCNGTASAASLLDMKYSFGFGVNDNGNVLGVTNNLDSNRSVTYTYDALNRIASASTANTDCSTVPTNSSLTKNWGESFTIDAWGNLTNRNVTKCSADLLSVVVLTNNRLSGFGYDAAGNMTSNGGASYTYNAESQLVTAGGVTYTYDGDGNRVKKSNGTLYWGTGPLLESDGSGNLQREFIFANGKRIARRDVSGGAWHYYFADNLGSTDVVAASAGTLENDSAYYPYGGERAYLTNLASQNYKFNGKERDIESGLDEFGARHYANAVGRFMIPDWAAKPTAVPYANYGNPQSLNLYIYVQNNPTTLGDPDGHCDICWQIAMWAAAGVSEQGGKQFAKNVGIGAAKGTGSFAFNTVKTLAAAGAGWGNPAAAVPVLMTPGPKALEPSNKTQAQVSTVTQVTLTAASILVPAASEATVAAKAPALVGFSETETSMIGQSLKSLSGTGYDLGPFQQLIKADMPPGCCAMSLSTEPTGAALGDGAFSSQQMLDHTLEEELLHLNQNLPSQTFGPGTAQELEGAVDATRKIPQPQ